MEENEIKAALSAADVKGQTRHQLAIIVIGAIAGFTAGKLSEKAYIAGILKWRNYNNSSSPTE
jgi:hypothetical protein